MLQSGGARLRLALIRQRYNPYGGAERFIERAIAALEPRGVEVTLLTREWEAASERSTRIVNPWHAGRLWRDVSFAREVRRVFERERFDLVQSHERIAGCDLYRAGDGVHRQWLAHRAAGAGLLERLGIRLNPYHHYVCAAEKAMFAHPSLRGVICNSRMVAQEIGRHFGVAAEKLHVIYNGVDLQHFHPRMRDELRAAARGELGCQQGDTVFAFVGSGFARKGLGAAIEALAASGRRDFRLVVAGSDRAARRYAGQARRAGIADRVHLLGGREDVRPVYAAADCFVLPTRALECFGLIVLEAFACNTPVIASNVAAIPELAERQGQCWMFEPGDAQQLADRMQAFIEQRLKPSVDLRAVAMEYEKAKILAEWERVLLGRRE